MITQLTEPLSELRDSLDGDLFFDDLHKTLYATDASVYRQIPVAVAFPKCEKDIQQLILFAEKNKIGIIPRTAGTSLAGQCVGDGLVVDVSKYFVFSLFFILIGSISTVILTPSFMVTANG